MQELQKYLIIFFTKLAVCQRVAGSHIQQTLSDEVSLIGIMCHILYDENLSLSLPCFQVQFSIDLSVFSSAQSFQIPSVYIYHFIGLLN